MRNWHAQDKPIRIGLVTFLSGPAAGPFGVPAKIAAEAIVDSLSAGKVMMKLGKGHQAVTGTAYGTTHTVDGQVTVGNIKYYALERVQPPEGVKSLDWIKSGMKAGNW